MSWTEGHLNRRGFLKVGLAGALSFLGLEQYISLAPAADSAPATAVPTATAAATAIPSPTRTPTAVPVTFEPFSVGLHNAHILPDLAPVTVRLPLNRKAFDRNLNQAQLSPEERDPFYLKGEDLIKYRKAGSKVILILETDPKDSLFMLTEMLEAADKTINFSSKDSIVIGNEINIRTDYPAEKYLEHAVFLHQKIKAINENIQVGISGEVWNGPKTFLRNLVSGLPFRPDFSPLHFYGLPQNLPDAVKTQQDILAQRSWKKVPVTIGETGIADSSFKDNPPGFTEGTREEQAYAIYKAFCFAKYAGCAGASWYSAMDTRASGSYVERYGLMIDAAKKDERLSFREFKTAAPIFNLPSRISKIEKDGYYVFVLEGADFITRISWQSGSQDRLGGKVEITTSVFPQR